MTTDELRAKFEAHFTPPPYEWIFTRYGKDSSWPHLYRHYDVQCAWEGWQAAHASRDAEVEALRKDVERLNWLEQDMKAGSDGTSIYYCPGKFCYPYLSSSGVGEKSENTLREAIDAAMAKESGE